MFESDDYDQILSQFEIPDVTLKQNSVEENSSTNHIGKPHNIDLGADSSSSLNRDTCLKPHKPLEEKIVVDTNSSRLLTRDMCMKPPISNITSRDQVTSPKHTKRKIINSYFDHKSKRKFPGPAGILNGSLEEPEDNSIRHMELLSQDIDFSQNNLLNIFESPLWSRLLVDVKKWNLCNIDSIKSIKQQAISGNLKRRKAQTITAFVEAVDRSAIDPLVILRDASGSIKCTLHRDAWSQFSPYIVSQYCVLVLWKPTILITGSAFKKYYLNITLSNIYAIYSSALLNEEAERKEMFEGFNIVYEDDFTVIKSNLSPSTDSDLNDPDASGNNLLDGLDSIFSEDIF